MSDHIKTGTHEACKEPTVLFQESISQQCSGDLKGNRKEQGMTIAEFLYHTIVVNMLTNLKNLSCELKWDHNLPRG
jgi:hypothetical protein